MSGDECSGPLRREDEGAADERQQGERVSDCRKKVFRGGGVSADDLADDRRRGAVERDADRPEVEDDGTCREARRVGPGRKDVGPVCEAEGGHCERNGPEKNAYTVIHSDKVFRSPCKSRTKSRQNRKRRLHLLSACTILIGEVRPI